MWKVMGEDWCGVRAWLEGGLGLEGSVVAGCVSVRGGRVCQVRGCGVVVGGG